MTSQEIKNGEHYVQTVLKSNGYYRVQIKNEKDPILEADGSIRNILVYVTLKAIDRDNPLDATLKRWLEAAKKVQREFWVAIYTPKDGTMESVKWLNLTNKL